MKEKRKREIEEMALAVDDRDRITSIPSKLKTHPATTDEAYKQSTVSPDITMKKVKSPEEILATKKLEIPKCLLRPTNGRIFVIDVSGYELKSPGGLILPPKFGPKKNDDVADIKRYFVVDWDTEEIPDSIKKYLRVGIEVNPFLNETAEEFDFPKVIDWQGNSILKCIHYTELAGISRVEPQEVNESKEL